PRNPEIRVRAKFKQDAVRAKAIDHYDTRYDVWPNPNPGRLDGWAAAHGVSLFAYRSGLVWTLSLSPLSIRYRGQINHSLFLFAMKRLFGNHFIYIRKILPRTKSSLTGIQRKCWQPWTSFLPRRIAAPITLGSCLA